MDAKADKLERLQNFIRGEWADGHGKPFNSINPASHRTVLADGNEASSEDVVRAIQAADQTYDSWRMLTPVQREEYFYRFLEIFGDPTNPSNEKVAEVAKLVASECGKTLNESRADVVEGIHMIRLCASRGRLPIGDHMPSEFPEKLLLTERVPRGVTAVITPWNFPFAIPWWLLGPSLIMGNTVVFKPAEQTALVGQKIVELCAQAGFPPGVINLVHGDAIPGKTLVAHPSVRSVLFTGSYEVGRAIKQKCAEDDALDKIAVLETGSKSAVIVLPDADIVLAVDATYKSAFKTTGQRCVSAGRVLVPRELLTEFVDMLLKTIKQNVREGDPFDPSTFMGPLIDKQGVQKVAFYNEAVRERKKTAHDSLEILLKGEMDLSKGYFAKPFVYVVPKYDPNFAPLREEVFGPHLAIIPYDTEEEALEIYEDPPYNLAVSFITQTNHWHELYRRLRHKAIVYVNLPTIGAEVQVPFGGTRRSGTGMPSAIAMFDHVTHPISITLNTSSTIRLAQGLK